jgi:prepilin-type processing-associated H-X9-DG protein
MYKIIGGDGKIYGPVSSDTIREWIASRRATANSQVRAEGSMEWKPLNEIAEFQGALPSGAPPLVDQTASVALPKTSRMAVVSLVLGILGCTSIIGLVLGIFALIRINNRRGTLGGRGIAIAGICVSAFMILVVIPIMATLSGVALPALAQAKEKAQSVECLNHLRQLGFAARQYAEKSDDQLLNSTNWCDALQPYATKDLFRCPGDRSKVCGYGYNAALSGRPLAEMNPLTVMFFEIPGGWNVSGGVEEMLQEPRHRRGFNVGFVDGSARQVRESELPTLRWEP